VENLTGEYMAKGKLNIQSLGKFHVYINGEYHVFEVSCCPQGLAQEIGYKAMRTKTGKTKMYGGAVTVTHIGQGNSK
jgi:hypothetical protein